MLGGPPVDEACALMRRAWAEGAKTLTEPLFCCRPKGCPQRLRCSHGRSQSWGCSGPGPSPDAPGMGRGFPLCRNSPSRGCVHSLAWPHDPSSVARVPEEETASGMAKESFACRDGWVNASSSTAAAPLGWVIFVLPKKGMKHWKAGPLPLCLQRGRQRAC